jgi:signal transduction histidine kinase
VTREPITKNIDQAMNAEVDSEPRDGRGVRPVDALVAACVTVIVAVIAVRAVEPGSRSPAVAGYLLAAVTGGLLLARRRWPVLVLVGLAVTVLAYNLAGFPGVGFLWPTLVGLYTATAAGHLLVAAAVGGAMVSIDAAWLLAADRHPLLPVVAMVVPDAVVAGLAIALGDAVRSRRGWAAESRERLRQVREDHEREARRAIVEERLRIARDLHDVTAHTLAVVAVQLNVATDALETAPEEVRAALRTASKVSDQAIGELTAAVRVLRVGDAAAERAPLPGLADLDRLVASTRATGLEVEFTQLGDPRRIPAATALTLYRVVQESLTNVVRHARAATAEVTIDYGPGAVTVRVSDDGLGAAGAGGAGHGLIGLRERVAGMGGRLTAGPAERQGFTVEAWIPAPERIPAQDPRMTRSALE